MTELLMALRNILRSMDDGWTYSGGPEWELYELIKEIHEKLHEAMDWSAKRS